MKRLIASLVVAACVWLQMASFASAEEDAVTTAINTLQRTSIYVAPDTDGTTSTSLSELKQLLKQGDHIVVVIIPSKGTTIPQSEAANKILASLKDPSILVLAYDRSVGAYSNKLPDTVTVDLISRAKSIARTPVEITTVFVSEVHKYQTAHPDPTPQASTPVVPKPAVPDGPNWPLLITSAFCVLACVGWLIFWKKRDPYPVRYAPSLVDERLHELKRLMPEIDDSRMSSQLGDIIRDTGMFFKRAKGVSESDIQGFAQRLRTAVELLEKYIEIQNEPRYAPVPPGAEALLYSGRWAIEGLSNSILKAVRDESAMAVLDFQMKADLLSTDIRRDYE